MNPHDAYATATARLAVLPNILRTRSEDGVRLTNHGALNGEFEARVLPHLHRVEKRIDDLEKRVASLEKATA